MRTIVYQNKAWYLLLTGVAVSSWSTQHKTTAITKIEPTSGDVVATESSEGGWLQDVERRGLTIATDVSAGKRKVLKAK